MTSADSMIDFEESMSKLEQIVSKMEQGQLTLEQSLAAFEEGVSLTKQCQSALKNAEQRVTLLLNQDELANADTDAESSPTLEVQSFNENSD